MSVTAAIRRMLDAGLTIEQALIASAAFEAEMPNEAPDLRTARQKRNARYYQKKTSEKHLKASDLDDQDADPLSPKEIPPTPPKEITPIPVSEAKASSPNARRRPSDFEVWYQHYPHKVQRGAAERAFVKALSLASLEELIAGVHRYVASKPADRQWQNPATWLNGKGWLDVPATPPIASATAPPKKTTQANMWDEEAIAIGIFDDPSNQTDRSLDASLSGGQNQGHGYPRLVAGS